MIEKDIKELLTELLPAVDFDSDFLFQELDSLGIATILYVLSNKYGILLDSDDVTPKNFRTVDSIAAMVKSKLAMESRIRQYSISTPDKVAVICSDEQMTYSRLWDAIAKRASELSGKGLKAHRPYVFRATQDIDFIVTYCAVHYLHAIAVPLEHMSTDVNFAAVKEEVESCTFSDDIVDILYTTGTTGKSKGVMLSETCLTSCADNFIANLGFTSDLLFIVSGPLNHIASLFKIHPTLSIGATVCVLDGLKDMNAFFRVFDLPYKKFATFLVPANIRMIMQFSYQRLCALADKIDFIETGAAPITSADMEQLSKALPHSRLYNTYGGTEIGCVSTYDFNDGKYMEGCIGRPMKNTSVEMAPEGNVIVSGLTIMSGYVNDTASTNQVIVDGKIHGSDLGYIDEDGLIHLTGRLGDVINVGGFKVNPQDVENVASKFPGVKDCICVAGKHPIIGTVLKLNVVMDAETGFDKKALASFLKNSLEPYKVPTYYESVPSIQRTYNGKLDRKFYRE